MITSDNTNVSYVGAGAPAVVDNQKQPPVTEAVTDQGIPVTDQGIPVTNTA